MNPKHKYTKPNNTPVYVKYIGLSFQLFGIIGGGTWLGWWLHQRSGYKFPVWLLVFCFFSIAIAFYQLWVSIRKDK
ncbi:AtpZ/AtpI family protein [Algoriphagus sp. NG3]|uniref:AtpZ/AtpI family protein n=1 Tax=unclassified Algoriphagus TaxID=2641541 RepID=UPI002A823593|nr:AtpZ/AtpI family protein [Algoriphagus sp. NG3]WPR75385.1 AtpZ/AtpI family protein [Algoriphagus sp. NG3]